MRAIINHKFFRPYLQQRVLSNPHTPNKQLLLIRGALRELNEFLSSPSVRASTKGSQARRLLIAAAAGEGVTHNGLQDVVGPLQPDFFRQASNRRKRALSEDSVSEL